MNMPLVRLRSGTKVMPVTANMNPAPRFTRRPNPLADSINRPNGVSGLGVALLTRPGPGGSGTEIVDSSGNTVYSAAQVAANPSLLTSLPSPCPGGMLPTWFPGGESICADNSTRTDEGTVAFAQFNYEVMGQCPVDGWCMTGSDPLNPASYVWQGGGTPTSLNPAIIRGAAPLPSVFNQPSGLPPASTVPVPPVFQAPAPPVALNPNISNVLSPPTGATSVTPQAIANASTQSGNTNVGAGTNSTSLSTLAQQAEDATGLSGNTLLLLAAAGIAAFMVFKK